MKTATLTATLTAAALDTTAIARRWLPPAHADTPTGAQHHAPVLLVHGLMDNSTIFTPMHSHLKRHGWQHLQAFNYSVLTTDIRKAAEKLAGQVDGILRRTRSKKIDIVAHSMGGLVARWYIQRLRGDNNVRTLITLGTPHAGTKAALPARLHPLARQMSPGSDFLKDLAGPTPSCRTRFVGFWSDTDHLMIPRNTARLDHRDLHTREVQLRGIGHLAMPVHSEVITKVRHELTS